MPHARESLQLEMHSDTFYSAHNSELSLNLGDLCWMRKVPKSSSFRQKFIDIDKGDEFIKCENGLARRKATEDGEKLKERNDYMHRGTHKLSHTRVCV